MSSLACFAFAKTFNASDRQVQYCTSTSKEMHVISHCLVGELTR